MDKVKRFISSVLVCALINMYTPALAKSVNVAGSTIIPITLKEQASSKHVDNGDKIEAAIAEDVIINNVIVFKAGGRAYLNVYDAKKAGFLGNPGELHLSNGGAFDANGIERRIEFSHKYVGEEKTYPKVLLGVSIFFLFPLALFAFVKGGQAKVGAGQIIDTSLRNPFTFTVSRL